MMLVLNTHTDGFDDSPEAQAIMRQNQTTVWSFTNRILYLQQELNRLQMTHNRGHHTLVQQIYTDRSEKLTQELIQFLLEQISSIHSRMQKSLPTSSDKNTTPHAA